MGESTEGGEFAGDENAGEPTDSETPVSGQSSCSLLNASSCAEGSACTPSSHGVRVCEENAVLRIGQACDAEEQERCVAGALCLVEDHHRAHCVEVCDANSAQCLTGKCNRWFEIDGETVGWCGDGE